jgi:AmiR/NasT family two-component response regulator
MQTTAGARIDLERVAALLVAIDQVVEAAKNASASSCAARVKRQLASSPVHPIQTELARTADELEGLKTAMATRAVIEQAKGMVMLQRKCDADAAFAELVALSQANHCKLYEIARALVAAWSEVERGDT